MKTLILCLLLVVGLGAGGVTGCSNWKQTAHKSAGVVVITADTAMKAWALHVKTGKATPEQEAKVREAYQKYQKAMLLVIDAGKGATLSGDQGTLQVVVSAAAGAQADLVGVINTFLPNKLK